MPVRWIAGSGGLANAYLFGPVLVDAGVLPMDVALYREQIRVIVLTHGHYDHTAHVNEIRRMCGARVCIHPLDAPALADDRRSVAMLFGARPPGAAADFTVEEGDTVEGLEVLHTPGHTPGGICLYHAGERILFSGDTVFTHGSFGRYDLPGGDLALLQRSIERLAGLDVEGLFPGHEAPVLQGGRRHILAAHTIVQGLHG